MAELLVDMVTFLTTAGIVLGDGKDTFRDTAPESPDSIVSIYEYPGDPIPLHDVSVHRSLQIVVRDKSATVAKTKANVIHAALNAPDKYMKLTDARWCMVYLRQVPFKIKVDDNGRTCYGFNLGITTNYD